MKTVRYKLNKPIEEVVIEYNEKEEVTNIRHEICNTIIESSNDVTGLQNDVIKKPRSADAVQGWIPLNGKLPKTIGHHVLVTIKWADDDLEVCEMCPTAADRYNIIAFQEMPKPYDGESLKSELQTLPGYDDIMEKLDGLTLKGGDHE